MRRKQDEFKKLALENIPGHDKKLRRSFNRYPEEIKVVEGVRPLPEH